LSAPMPSNLCQLKKKRRLQEKGHNLPLGLGK